MYKYPEEPAFLSHSVRTDSMSSHTRTMYILCTYVVHTYVHNMYIQHVLKYVVKFCFNSPQLFTVSL